MNHRLSAYDYICIQYYFFITAVSQKSQGIEWSMWSRDSDLHVVTCIPMRY